jgi:hypothetical protein
MKNLVLIVLLALTCNLVLSQKNYRPGSVVTLNGEKITGEIDYKNWKQTPEKIVFRKDASSAGVSYGVNDISSFSVSDDMYRRAIVEIVEREDELNKLRIGDSFPSRTDTVFLLALVSGPKSLYYYTDNVDHFYITNDDGNFELLNYRKFKDVNQNVATIKFYLSQLKAYFSNCSVVSNNLKYNPSDLRKTFLSYYDCIGKGPEYFQKTDNEKIELGLLVGATNTSFKVSTSGSDLVGKVDYSKSNDVTAGIFADLVFPRRRGRISLNNELMYSSYKTEGSYGYAVNPYIFDDYTYEFQYSYVKLNNMLRYKFFANNLIIYINGGFSNGFVINEVNRYVKVRTANGDKSTSSGTAFQDTRKWELGLLAGAGVRFNRASLELRAERGMGPFRAVNYAAKVDRFSALVGFRLK